MTFACRSGSRRDPSSTTMVTVPARSGMPTSVNSKKPNRPAPRPTAASETRTFTGVPVSANIEPAWAAKARGIRSCDGDSFSRTASTTTIGTSAATAPLTLMSAVSAATRSIVKTTRRRRLAPARMMSC